MNSSIFNSKRLPRALLIAIVLVPLTMIVFFCYLQKTDSIPAPMFSNSISLDEKFKFLRLRKEYQADYIVLASSTGLSNIFSESMMNHPKINQNYINYSAWGLNMTAILYYWNFIKKIAHPKVVIVTIDLDGFNRWHDNNANFNKKDVKSYLDGANPAWYYFKYHKNGFGERIGKVIRHGRRNDTQHSTKFDRAGGVPLHVTEESEITRKKWKDGVTADWHTEGSYDSLDKMLINLKQSGIIAVIVQPPLREHYMESESEFGFVKDHFNRVAAITKQNGAYFFNMQDIFPEDASLFSDSSHLNQWSAEEFTRQLLERMEEEGIFQKVNDSIVYSD